VVGSIVVVAVLFAAGSVVMRLGNRLPSRRSPSDVTPTPLPALPPLPYVVRPAIVQRVLFGGLIAIGGLVLSLVAATSFPSLGWLLIVGGLLCTGVVVARWGHVELSADAQGVTIVNLAGCKPLAWADIARVELAGRHALVFVSRDGRRVRPRAAFLDWDERRPLVHVLRALGEPAGVVFSRALTTL